MISLDGYCLSDSDRAELQKLLVRSGPNPSLKTIWKMMDQAWDECQCDNRNPDQDSLASFYRHPIWILNGIFIEQDAVSMQHRTAIANTIRLINPARVVDFGGGFGTLSRLLACRLPQSKIDICEPFPATFAIERCREYGNISFVAKLLPHCYDVLVSTDVLEHVLDPLALLADMTDSVREGGYLLLANCFFPVIKAHLPINFHFRYSFNQFCPLFGIEEVADYPGSYATVYRKVLALNYDWDRIRSLESRSRLLYPLKYITRKANSILFRRPKSSLERFLHYFRT
jgi:2-polyprenyl-3-methyl-5-hydroxy-6-metoxy-1,4-benzoquinol methylase